MRAALRVGAAVAVVGRGIASTPGVASAHVPTITTAARCVHGGGWQGTITVRFSDAGHDLGHVLATYPGLGGSWSALAPETPRTFGSGVTIPVSVGSVTFTATGSWERRLPVRRDGDDRPA